MGAAWKQKYKYLLHGSQNKVVVRLTYKKLLLYFAPDSFVSLHRDVYLWRTLSQVFAKHCGTLLKFWSFSNCPASVDFPYY